MGPSMKRSAVWLAANALDHAETVLERKARLTVGESQALGSARRALYALVREYPADILPGICERWADEPALGTARDGVHARPNA